MNQKPTVATRWVFLRVRLTAEVSKLSDLGGGLDDLAAVQHAGCSCIEDGGEWVKIRKDYAGTVCGRRSLMKGLSCWVHVHG